jgi:pimeloyl-ACP methyl ester carboxylesterase/tetratricopeptide (TPR) repeat protein
MKITRGRILATIAVSIVAAVAYWLVPGYVESRVRLTTTEPQFIGEPTKPDTVVVFVHGVFGDTVDTWKNPNGVRFFDLLKQDPAFKGKFDVYAFGFSSNYFMQGSFSIGEAAKRLRLHVDRHLSGYQRMIFVAHSMGGLVTMSYLLMDSRMARRVPLLVLFSTPQNPNQLAAVARHVTGNDGLVDMRESRDNRFFDDLDDRWKNASPLEIPHVVCAYEKLDTFGVLVVPKEQARQYCNEASPPIGENHITIVKPHAAEHDSYRFAALAIGKEIKKPAKYVSPHTLREEFEIQSLEKIIQNNVVNTPQEALKDAELLIKQFPAYANGYRLKGVALWNLGKIKDAEKPNMDGLKLDAEPAVKEKLRFNLASVFLVQGRYSDSRPLISELEKTAPDDDEVRILRAVERLHAGDYAAAQTRFQELLKLSTPGARPFVRMGLGFSLALASSKDDATAARYLREAISLDSRTRRVFMSSDEELMLENWNYTLFRELYGRIKSRPALRDFATKEAAIASMCP